jgi:hypothetical protein
VREINVLVPEAAQRFIEAADCIQHRSAERHVAAAQPLGPLIGARVIRRAYVESAPIDLVPVRCKAKETVHGVAGDVVMAGMIDKSSDAAKRRIVVECDRVGNPSLRQPDIVVQKRNDLSLGQRDSGIARPRRSETCFELGNVELEAIRELLPDFLGSVNGISLKNEDDLELVATNAALGREILEDTASKAQDACGTEL